MNTKNTIIMVFLVLMFAGIGYFLFTERVPQNTNPEKLGEPTQQTGSQAKININQVCDESLMFTTFTDSVAAELYLKECKEGKRPEVIEAFKVRMGITNDQAI